MCPLNPTFLIKEPYISSRTHSLKNHISHQEPILLFTPSIFEDLFIPYLPSFQRGSSIPCFLFLGIILWSLTTSNAREWPKNIKRCARNMTNINKCLMRSAKAAMTLIAKGNKDLGIRSLDPMKLGNTTISNELKPIVVRFQITNGLLEGASKMVFQNISYDLGRREMAIKGLHKKLKISGFYDTIGNLYTLNFKGKGKFVIENRNVQVFHRLKFEPTTKRDYMDMDLSFLVMDIGRTRMTFNETLLPPQASSVLSRMVNENWREVTTAMTPSVERLLQRQMTSALAPLFKRFPMSTIFPERL